MKFFAVIAWSALLAGVVSPPSWAQANPDEPSVWLEKRDSPEAMQSVGADKLGVAMTQHPELWSTVDIQVPSWTC